MKTHYELSGLQEILIRKRAMEYSNPCYIYCLMPVKFFLSRDNEFGKFTIKVENNKFVIDEWQGETKQFPLKRIPTAEIADCINWLSEEEKGKLKTMIGNRRYSHAVNFAKKMHWIDED